MHAAVYFQNVLFNLQQQSHQKTFMSITIRVVWKEVAFQLILDFKMHLQVQSTQLFKCRLTSYQATRAEDAEVYQVT